MKSNIEQAMGNKAAAHDRGAFGSGDVRRVDEAPAGADVSVIHQPFDRPRAAPREAGFDLGHLLGDMDMNRRARRQRGHRRQLVRGRRAQAVRRDADNRLVEAREEIDRLLQVPSTGGEQPIAHTQYLLFLSRHQLERLADLGATDGAVGKREAKAAGSRSPDRTAAANA